MVANVVWTLSSASAQKTSLLMMSRARRDCKYATELLALLIAMACERSYRTLCLGSATKKSDNLGSKLFLAGPLVTVQLFLARASIEPIVHPGFHLKSIPACRIDDRHV